VSTLDSIDTEVAVLSAVFADPATLWDAMSIVESDHFRDRRNQYIFSALSSLATNGMPYDMSAVRTKLRQDGDMFVVTESHLSSLEDLSPDTTNVAWYANKIKESFVRIEAIKETNRLKAQLEQGGNLKEILDDHSKTLLDLHGGLAARSEAVHISRPVGEAMDLLAKMRAGDISGLGVRTGVGVLDDRFSFFAPKNVYVICGGVSAGKSALADQIADYVAGNGSNVYVSCLEMSAMQRAQRFISRRARVSLKAWQAKDMLSKAAEESLQKAAAEFRKPPIYIDDARGLTALDIMAKARRFRDTHGLGMLIIDYLQLMKPLRRGPREQEVAEMSGAVLDISGDLDVPVILVSQLSRTHQHENREPELRDLRESGRIEQDAFGVVAIYRPHLEEPESKVIVLKNRQGPLGRRQMRFIGEQVRFEEIQSTDVYYKEAFGGN